MNSTMWLQTDIDRPLLFRTVDKDVYQNTIENGSVWLRSSHYYREIEDQARSDQTEGINGTKSSMPLQFKAAKGNSVRIEGPGIIGCEIIPHYIMSLHGAAISDDCRHEFGGYTFGVKCIRRLSAEILYQASRQIDVHGYRYGQVAYQYTALSMSYDRRNVAIGLGGNPEVGVKSLDTDVLRKEPVEPFIFQDEWRIVIFPLKYLDNDSMKPLKINVSPEHFFEYISPKS